jgi:hypothetical protein
LLELSQQGAAVSKNLAADLTVAAWFRADLLEKHELARQAAALVAQRVPELREAANRYIASATPAEARDVLVRTTLIRQLSPQVYHEGRYLAGQARPLGVRAGEDWCGFDAAHLTKLARLERSPALSPELLQAVPQSGEIEALKAVGSGTRWFARQALDLAKRLPADPLTPRLLRAVVQSSQGDSSCPAPEAAELRAQAMKLLTAGRSDLNRSPSPPPAPPSRSPSGSTR